MTKEPASNYSNRRESALKDGSPEYKEKRQELVRIAALLFKEKGFKATTLRDIAKRAGLDRATVYYYVGNKDEFFREAIKGSLDANLEEAEKLVRRKSIDAVEKLQCLIRLLMTSYHDSYPYMYVYIQDGINKVASDPSPWAKEMSEQTRRFENAVIQIINQGIKAGIFRDDVPVNLAVNSLFGMLNWTHHWYKPGEKHDLEEVIGSFGKIFIGGFGRE